MKSPLQEALSRQAKLAFRRVRPGAQLLRRFCALPEDVCTDASLQQLCAWLVVPVPCAPVEVLGKTAE